VCPHIPVTVDAVLQKALALNINDRYASAHEMRSALRQALVASRPAAVSSAAAPQFSGVALAGNTGGRVVPAIEATVVVSHQAQPTMIAPPRLFTPGSVPTVHAGPVARPTQRLWTYWIAANTLWLLVFIG